MNDSRLTAGDAVKINKGKRTGKRAVHSEPQMAEAVLVSDDRVKTKNALSQDNDTQMVVQNVRALCQKLKAEDILAHSRFVKEIRQALGDAPLAPGVSPNPWVDAIGIMKDNPIWPEIKAISAQKKSS